MTSDDDVSVSGEPMLNLVALEKLRKHREILGKRISFTLSFLTSCLVDKATDQE